MCYPHHELLDPKYKTMCYRGVIEVEFQNENIIYTFKEFCCENFFDKDIFLNVDSRRRYFSYDLSRKEGERAAILTEVKLCLKPRVSCLQKDLTTIPIVHNRSHSWVERDPFYI